MALGLDVPITSNEWVPTATAPVSKRVSWEVPGGVTGLGENPAAAPAGSPEGDRVTGSLKPWNCSTEMSKTAGDGAQTATVSGSTVTRKSSE